MRGGGQMKINSCFIVVLGVLLLIFLNGCAHRDPSVDFGVAYTRDIEDGDNDAVSLKASLNQTIYESKEGAVKLRGGGGPMIMGVRTGKRMDPAGGVHAGLESEFRTSENLSIIAGVTGGMMYMKPNVPDYGDTGAIGLIRGEAGIKWKDLKVAAVFEHTSDVADKDHGRNCVGAVVETSWEALSRLVKKFSKSKSPK
jgi:hypothetical protein